MLAKFTYSRSLSHPSQTEFCPVPEFPQIKAYNRKRGGEKTEMGTYSCQKSLIICTSRDAGNKYRLLAPLGISRN